MRRLHTSDRQAEVGGTGEGHWSGVRGGSSSCVFIGYRSRPESRRYQVLRLLLLLLSEILGQRPKSHGARGAIVSGLPSDGRQLAPIRRERKVQVVRTVFARFQKSAVRDSQPLPHPLITILAAGKESSRIGAKRQRRNMPESMFLKGRQELVVGEVVHPQCCRSASGGQVLAIR